MCKDLHTHVWFTLKSLKKWNRSKVNLLNFIYDHMSWDRPSCRNKMELNWMYLLSSKGSSLHNHVSRLQNGASKSLTLITLFRLQWSINKIVLRWNGSMFLNLGWANRDQYWWNASLYSWNKPLLWLFIGVSILSCITCHGCYCRCSVCKLYKPYVTVF